MISRRLSRAPHMGSWTRELLNSAAAGQPARATPQASALQPLVRDAAHADVVDHPHAIVQPEHEVDHLPVRAARALEPHLLVGARALEGGVQLLGVEDVHPVREDAELGLLDVPVEHLCVDLACGRNARVRGEALEHLHAVARVRVVAVLQRTEHDLDYLPGGLPRRGLELAGRVHVVAPRVEHLLLHVHAVGELVVQHAVGELGPALEVIV
mmetsp:Transcript_8207/g.27872  ORF Transcript_8207/g.27872 Transcript_8207/m.27872 type:complete len:212 (-) Transcript_8207:290-925(-)